MHKYKLYFDQENGRLYSDGLLIGSLNYNEKLILEHLIENQGDICTKEVLISIGWPNRIVVPNSLNIAIRKIRDIFKNGNTGLSSELETVPKIGYRLNSSVLFQKTLEHEPSIEPLQIKEFTPTTEVKKISLARRVLILIPLFFSMILGVLIVSHKPNLTCTSDHKKNITICGNSEHDITQELLPGSSYWFIKNYAGDYEYIKVR